MSLGERELIAELLRAIDKNVTSANVHSSKHTGGETRGQIAREN